MDGNLSSGNMISGSGGSFDLQNSMRVHHQQQQQHHQNHLHHHNPQSTRHQESIIHPSIHENFPFRIGTVQDCNRHNQPVSLSGFIERERGKISVSDEDEQEETRGKNPSQWHRVKWNDPMVRILITAVSYIGEDASMEYGGGSRRKYSNLQKKGKWKSVSKVMAERGHFVSPQQCEDKFNDLNKRYKRLNEILGRGTSCEVVENPSLLDLMDHISDKSKDEVKKILSSKHLYYEEMCSYHNGNRLHLPPDPELQRSLRLALRNDGKRLSHEDLDDDDDDDPYMDDHDEYHGLNLDQPKNVQADMNQEGMKVNFTQDQWIKHRSIQLEEEKVRIQSQILELEKERFKWQRFSQKKEMELQMMRMENERMKLENEQMAIELKRKEMSADVN